MTTQHPTEFFVFCNTAMPMTEHNLRYTRSITSAGYSTATMGEEQLTRYLDGTLDNLLLVPHNPGEVAISMFNTSITNNYQVEYQAEYYRRKYFSNQPSRLSAVYAFGDYISCQKANLLYNWNLSNVRRFRLVSEPAMSKLARVNMNVISLARTAYLVSKLEHHTEEQIWQHYWQGGGNLQMELPDVGASRHSVESGILWEYLIEGQLQLVEGEEPPGVIRYT